MTIIIFITLFSIIGLIIFISISKNVPPSKKTVNKYHRHKFLDFEKYAFYYERATAYRVLFQIHTTINIFFNILGTVATFVTLYCAVDKNSFTLLFSLISASFTVIHFTIPFERYARIYVLSARKLEHALNDNYLDKSDNQVFCSLETAYIDSEKIIESDFM